MILESMEQSLRQREQLNKTAGATVTEIDLHKAAIVCGCFIGAVILSAVGVLLTHAWPVIVKWLGF